jgi:hypothetical protein
MDINTPATRRGRPPDSVWEHFEKLDDRKYKCKFCQKIYSKPVSIALRAHLSNFHYARKYKITLCPASDPQINEKYVLEFRNMPTQDKRHSEAPNEHIVTFFNDHNIPLDAFTSNSFFELVESIKKDRKMSFMKYLENSDMFSSHQEEEFEIYSDYIDTNFMNGMDDNIY